MFLVSIKHYKNRETQHMDYNGNGILGSKINWDVKVRIVTK